MSTELVLTPEQQAAKIAELQSKYDSGFDEIASSTKFLPRLQLFTSNSEAVQTQVIPVAHYGMVKGKNNITDLGKSVLCMPLAYRAKALDTKANPIVAFHVQTDERFKAIVKRANANANSGCLYGPEFLVWLPDHGFVTFLMGSKSARNEAGVVRACIDKAMVLTANFIVGKEYKWHAPKAELSMQGIYAPPADRKAEILLDFLNPPDAEEEEVADGNTADVTR